MNWYRVVAALTLPTVLATPIVAFCVRGQRILTGTILGCGVFFAGFALFAAWEFGEALSHAQSVTEPSVFTKIVVYGFVAMMQAMALFLISDRIERRIKDTDRDRAWR